MINCHEPANFYSICKLLYRLGSTDTQVRVVACRKDYSEAINGTYFQVNLHGAFEGKTVGPKEIFETWLYVVTFHQAPDRQAMVEDLARFQDGHAFPFAVNVVAHRISGAVLALDDVLADHLRESRLPRIGNDV